MNKKIKLSAIVPVNLDNMRLDQVLAKLFPDYSRSQLTKWIYAKQGQVNGHFLKPKIKIKAGQEIMIDTELTTQQHWQAQPLALNIVYQDDDMIVINKPANLVVHPGAGNPDQTLVNALLHHFPELETLPRAGIIHRLDKDTSGLLIVARSLPAYTQFVKALQNREIKREYEAVVEGQMIAGGKIEAPIGRNPTERTKMAVLKSGKPAMTRYRIIKKYNAHTHLHLELETGRTHQIRVHLAYIHYPLVGDKIYNRAQKTKFHRQALHACRLSLTHPISQEKMVFTAELPEDIQELLKRLL